jgi:hypothetical protein
MSYRMLGISPKLFLENVVRRICRIGLMLAVCFVALIGCKPPNSDFVGKWESTQVSGRYIEISAIDGTRFHVVSPNGEENYFLCGNARDWLCNDSSGNALTVRRIRFPEKGNRNLLLYGELGDGADGETVTFFMKLAHAGEDTFKRVQ